MLKEENELLFLKMQSLLKSKLKKKCVELWPTVIVTKNGIFFPGGIKIYLLEYVTNNSSNSFQSSK